MEDAEANTGKPLLLEEFGKIVWEKDFVKGMIEKKRNPVYEAMTGVTMDSVFACVPPLSPVVLLLTAEIPALLHKHRAASAPLQNLEAQLFPAAWRARLPDGGKT